MPTTRPASPVAADLQSSSSLSAAILAFSRKSPTNNGSYGSALSDSGNVKAESLPGASGVLPSISHRRTVSVVSRAPQVPPKLAAISSNPVAPSPVLGLRKQSKIYQIKDTSTLTTTAIESAAVAAKHVAAAIAAPSTEQPTLKRSTFQSRKAANGSSASMLKPRPTAEGASARTTTATPDQDNRQKIPKIPGNSSHTIHPARVRSFSPGRQYLSSSRLSARSSSPADSLLGHSSAPIRAISPASSLGSSTSMNSDARAPVSRSRGADRGVNIRNVRSSSESVRSGSAESAEKQLGGTESKASQSKQLEETSRLQPRIAEIRERRATPSEVLSPRPRRPIKPAMLLSSKTLSTANSDARNIPNTKVDALKDESQGTMISVAEPSTQTRFGIPDINAVTTTKSVQQKTASTHASSRPVSATFSKRFFADNRINTPFSFYNRSTISRNRVASNASGSRGGGLELLADTSESATSLAVNNKRKAEVSRPFSAAKQSAEGVRSSSMGPASSRRYNNPTGTDLTPLQSTLRTTMRKPEKQKHIFNSEKPWKHAVVTGTLTEEERKRYDALWAANRGLMMPAELSNCVHGLVVKQLWKRSRLDREILEKIW
ncbi:uncharacterized protein V2V93DRAFT_177709 [Kockiozyma suomiensis]|uniref:uncharacterized protein n=1 Tax=Kockiozyma suomiensis TaxID=1337062 RepID=UPI00334331F8